MRTWALLLAALLVSGVLAGCASKDTPAATPDGTSGGGDPLHEAAVIKVLSPLKLNITAKTPTGTAWVAPGATLDLQAVQPVDAVGAVSYYWAAGPLPGTALISQPAKPDTGSKDPSLYLQPGQSVGIRYTVPGAWQLHCHPHPWMRSNVTVIEGFDSPSQVDVYIVDGATSSEFRFVPENIVVKPNTVVLYHNAGTVPHTATSLAQDPPAKPLAIKGTGGSIALDAKALGWQRILLFSWDSAGHMGRAHFDVYQSDLPAFAKRSVPFSFPVAGTPAGGLPSAAQPPVTNNFVTSYNGTIYLNYTVDNPAAASGQSANLVSVHLKLQGESQDTLTSSKKDHDALMGRGLAGTYNLEIDPEQGADVTGTVTVEIVYDLIPPAPTGYVDPESIPHTH